MYSYRKREHHDLEPARGRDGLERREATRRHVGELEVLRHREVARQTNASLNRDHVEEPEHRRAAVLDFLSERFLLILVVTQRTPFATRTPLLRRQTWKRSIIACINHIS